MIVGVLLVGWGWTIEQMRSGWLELERLGYDVCYIGDDLFPHPDVDSEVWEPWSLLPAVAESTERIRLGSLVSPAGRRHPGLFAKSTTTIDHLSGGRLIVGRGLGNEPDQQRTLGQPFAAPAERTEVLREELEILRSMWTQRRTTVEGAHFQVRGAINEPKPVSRPHPEILVAYRSRKFLPPLAAEFAQRVNLLESDDERVRRHVDLLARLCEERGRAADSILIGRPASIAFHERELAGEERDGFLRQLAPLVGADPDYLVTEYQRLLSFVGPPQRCVEVMLERTVALGVRELVVCAETIGNNTFERTMDFLREFAAEVLSDFQRA